MADEQTPQAGTTDAAPATAAQPAAATAAPAQDAEDVNALPPFAQRLIADLRKEAASHRKAKTDAEKAAQAQAEQTAKEQGKWRELAEQYEPAAKRAQELEAFIAETLAAETASVPDKLKKLIPQGDPLTTLRWVREAKAAGILSAPAAPQTDARDVPATGTARFGLPPEEFAAIYGLNPAYLGK